ncbi:MAG: Crp/Fnr family transcriptional regulator [Candidatus Saccharibacteria bacterium]|nr:Crp/Fnr family transcriptional regulator [Candidatus Saccharibacteria bacterium]
MLATKQQVESLIKLFKSGTKLTYKKGEQIIRPGEQPSGVFYIDEGLVKAYDISKYGEENLLIIRRSHDIFPLIWAITGEERDINYEALEPTTVWRISRKVYQDYLYSPDNNLAPILDMVVENYRIHSERLLNLEYRSVRERVISFLITMAKHFGEETPEGIQITAPLRHQDIASSINSSRETASREMAYLERKGLIRNNQSKVLLLDIEKLKSHL